MFKIDTIGSDPELILHDANNQPISAIGLYDHQSDVKLYADNVLAEFSHNPFTPDQFVEGINKTLASVKQSLSNFAGGVSFTIGQCEASYSDDQLSSPEAHTIGCQPFYNAYNMGVKRTPVPYTNNTRYAGGHIHIGYDKNTLPPHLLVRLLDERLLPLDPNRNSTRADFYGAPGSYRDKPYGVEYRATSNWWLANPQIIVDTLADIETYVNKRYYGGAL